MNIKNIIFIVILGGFSLFQSCSHSGEDNKTTVIVRESDIVKKNIGVNGMTCVGCEVTLEKNISKIKGVVNVKASHSDNEAIIEFDSTKTNIDTIRKKIIELGYEPTVSADKNGN
jgi:copper chaperone CopZ